MPESLGAAGRSRTGHSLLSLYNNEVIGILPILAFTLCFVHAPGVPFARGLFVALSISLLMHLLVLVIFLRY